MKFQSVYGAGVEVYGSHACLHSDKNELAHLSVIGAESSVNAVLASILENKTISLYTDDGGKWPLRNRELHYMKLVRPLPVNSQKPRASDRWVQGFVCLKLLLNTIDQEYQADWWPNEKTCRFGMLVSAQLSQTELAQEYFNRLRLYLRKTPVDKAWASWLWQYAKSKEMWVEPYPSVIGDLNAYVCRVWEEELQQAIQDAIRQRVPEIVQVFGDEGQEPIVRQPITELQKTCSKGVSLILMGKSQRSVVLSNCRGEEGEFFQAKLQELEQVFTTMPKTYETDGQGYQAVAYLHYFSSNSDWWITELDMEDEQLQAYGLACLNGDWMNAEMGYISLQELVEHNVELDLYWTPKTIKEIKEY